MHQNSELTKGNCTAIFYDHRVVIEVLDFDAY